MSLWTPSGEHPVGDEGRTPGTASPLSGQPEAPPRAGGPTASRAAGDGEPQGDAEADRSLDDLRRRLADAPAEVVVANHCYGLFELAAVYLSQAPPRLEQAQLAIDALGHLVDGLGDRLGEAHGALRDALAQVRLAYVQLGAASQAEPGGPEAGDREAAGEDRA